MKVATLFGTRPEIIRLSQIVPQLDRHCQHTLIHTGQNYDPALSDIFFDELGLRQPDIHLGVQAQCFAEQIGQILQRTAQVFDQLEPARLLVLGDTNSGLAALVAARMGIDVYHLEAGNRCFDDRVPEEINRRVIDHCSNVLMPYTNRSKEHLLREGIEWRRIFVVGNPIYSVLKAHDARIEASTIMDRMGLLRGDYFLATLHRAENVDDRGRLKELLEGLSLVADTFQVPVVVSLHPRTADRIARNSLRASSSRVRLVDALGFIDFVKLEVGARCVLTDSGTVQEECCIAHVPNVTIRDVTERPETLDCGSNILTGAEPRAMLRAVEIVLAADRDWTPPPEYVQTNVASTVVKVVLGFHHNFSAC
jgi:UDP-N-acetylglucosamine 2-epimerase (non-hydrolysing)